MNLAAHTQQMELAQKDQLLEIYPGARLGLPIICLGLSVPSDEPCSSAPDRLLKVMDLQGPGSEHGTRTNLLFTMSYRTGAEPKARRKSFFLANDLPSSQHQRFGGAGRDRTDDILLAKQALSQLSYGP